MRIIYLQGEAATGKTIWARKHRRQYPNAVVLKNFSALEFPGMLALEVKRQNVFIDNWEDLTVIIDPDGQPFPVELTLEVINFDRGGNL